MAAVRPREEPAAAALAEDLAAGVSAAPAARAGPEERAASSLGGAARASRVERAAPIIVQLFASAALVEKHPSRERNRVNRVRNPL
jgi:hypothetical protein